jgi:hypothetical protein
MCLPTVTFDRTEVVLLLPRPCYYSARFTPVNHSSASNRYRPAGPADEPATEREQRISEFHSHNVHMELNTTHLATNHFVEVRLGGRLEGMVFGDARARRERERSTHTKRKKRRQHRNTNEHHRMRGWDQPHARRSIAQRNATKHHTNTSNVLVVQHGLVDLWMRGPQGDQRLLDLYSEHKRTEEVSVQQRGG